MNGVNIYKCPNISKKTVKSKPEVEWIQTWKPLLSSQMLAWIIVFAPRFREDEMGSILPLPLSSFLSNSQTWETKGLSRFHFSEERDYKRCFAQRDGELFNYTKHQSGINSQYEKIIYALKIVELLFYNKLSVFSAFSLGSLLWDRIWSILGHW